MRKTQGSRFPPNFAVFEPQGPGKQERLIFGIKENSKIWAKYGFVFTCPYSFCRLLAYLPGLYLSKKGGLTL